MDESLIVKLSKPFAFEGEIYDEIDLSALAELTTADLCQAQRQYNMGANVSTVPEMDVNYCILLAQKASKLPLEFFQQLPARDGMKVRLTVTKAFFG